MTPEIDKDIVKSYNFLIQHARIMRHIAGKDFDADKRIEQGIAIVKDIERDGDVVGGVFKLRSLFAQTRAKDAPFSMTLKSGKRFEYIPYPEAGSYIHVVTVGDTAIGMNKETNHLQFLSGTKVELLEADKSLGIRIPARKTPLFKRRVN